MAKTTPTPKSLSISRSGRNFTFSWVKNGKYEQSKLEVAWRYKYKSTGKWGKWVYPSVTKGTKSFTLKNTPTSNLASVQFGVRSKRKGKKYGFSAWAYQEFKLAAPSAPEIGSITVADNTNRATYNWSGSHSDSDHYPYTSTQLQTKTVKNWNGKYGWAAPTASNTEIVAETGSKTYTDNPPNGGSIARLIRVRRRGPGGDSAWKEMNHVFAIPYAASVKSAKITKKAGSCSVSCTWELSRGWAHPVDSITVQHAIGVPASNGAFNNASWNDGDTLAYTAVKMSQQWNADAIPGDDECLWVRVVAKHDGKASYSNPYRAYQGKLAKPTLGEVTLSDGNLTIEATNNSTVPDSYLKAFFRTGANTAWKDMGKMVNDEITFSIGSVTNYQVAVQAFAPNMTASDRAEGDGSQISEAPVPPTTVTATAIDAETVTLTWDWAWENATSFELSWATRSDAWHSTKEPSTHEVNSRETSWNIGDLEAGQTYYFRVRLAKGELKSRWSDLVEASINPSVITPDAPALSATEYVTDDGTVSFSVGFDGDAQAIVAEKIDDEYITIITGNVSSALSITVEDVNAIFNELGRDENLWIVGTEHEVHAKVVRNQMESGWSVGATIGVKAKPDISEIATNLSELELTSVDDQGETFTRTVLGITAFPLNITVNGTGEDVSVALSVIRAEPSVVARPDETREAHFAGEVIFTTVVGFGVQQAITLDNLIGVLDDGLPYRIIASATDAYGQKAESNLDFEVHWTHQPVAPEVTIETSEEDLITKITVAETEAIQAGDTFDIYRMSADKPELIVRDGVYGVTYVDPYPAFGEHGGHRIVAKAVNGDFVMADGGLAWTDTDIEDGDVIEMSKAVVDFDGDSILIDYNLELSNSWEKDFKRTAYLGGSVQGDWNPAVTRDGTIKSLFVIKEEQDMVDLLRDIAIYAGACHVRTPDGSSFWANIDYNEEWKYEEYPVLKAKLDFNKIDAQSLDGMTLEEWNKMNEEDET